jgi:hypothetical protein
MESPPRRAGMLAIIHDFKRIFRDSPSEGEALRRMRSAVERMKDQGFAGIVTNVSEKNYLRDESAWGFFGEVLEECRRLDLRVWIYDEVGYPSGTAGGMIPREHPEYEAVGLVRLVDDVEAGPVRLDPPLMFRYPVAAYALSGEDRTDITGEFDDSGVLDWTAPAKARVLRYVCRRAFEGTHATRNVACTRRYINVLDPDAMQAFIETTHAEYLRRFPDLAKTVDAVFTDEPSFMTTYHPELPERYVGKIPIEDEPDPRVPALPMLPWWEALPDSFLEMYGYDLLPHLDRLFCEAETGPDGEISSRVRQDFYELLSRQYTRAYFEQTQQFLDGYGIAMTGHVLHEEPLWHHAGSEGHSMLALSPMEIPGCDILEGHPDRLVSTLRLITPKYASSVAHLHGRKEVMSETSDWQQRNHGEFAILEERRGNLALQMMLGVTTFTSYFSWKEFEEKEIRRLARFVSRVSAVVREGVHETGIGILYPIRSVWSRFVPLDHWTGLGEGPDWLLHLETTLHRVAKTLFSTQRDFDLVDEDSLIRGKVKDGAWRIGEEEFCVLILPPGTILTEPAAEAVEGFIKAGGKVIAFQPDPVVPLSRGPKGKNEPLASVLKNREGLHLFDGADSPWLEKVAESVTPSLGFDPPSTDLYVRRARTDSARLFLVVNTSRNDYHGTVDVGGGHEIWDPWTGSGELGPGFEVEAFSARVVTTGLAPVGP